MSEASSSEASTGNMFWEQHLLLFAEDTGSEQPFSLGLVCQVHAVHKKSLGALHFDNEEGLEMLCCTSWLAHGAEPRTGTKS